MDKKHENEMKRLAKKALAKYRIARRAGYSPKVARSHAHFSIMCLSGGRKNLFAENLLRRYEARSNKACSGLAPAGASESQVVSGASR